MTIPAGFLPLGETPNCPGSGLKRPVVGVEWCALTALCEACGKNVKLRVVKTPKGSKGEWCLIPNHKAETLGPQQRQMLLYAQEGILPHKMREYEALQRKDYSGYGGPFCTVIKL